MHCNCVGYILVSSIANPLFCFPGKWPPKSKDTMESEQGNLVYAPDVEL